MNNIKNIIREVEPEYTDFSIYFDNDGLTEVGGDYCYNLFIVSQSRNQNGFNEESYKKVYDEIELLVSEWDNFKYAKEHGYELNYKSFSDIVAWNTHNNRGGFYINSLKNANKLSELRQFIEWLSEPSKAYGYSNRVNWEADEEGCVAKYLTIKTGKEWDTESAHGYCQGDSVVMVYCKEHYKEGVKHYGEVWLGAAKEFCVINLDENGEESNTCYGFIVADCQARENEDYKRLVCEWACIKENETQLEMIDGSRTYRKYSYRIS